MISLVYFVHWELKGGTFVMGSKPHALRAGGLESWRHRHMALVINMSMTCCNLVTPWLWLMVWQCIWLLG